MSRYPLLACVGALAILFVPQLPAQPPGQAPKAAAKAKSKAVPRTPDGHPDLQGPAEPLIVTRSGCRIHTSSRRGVVVGTKGETR